MKHRFGLCQPSQSSCPGSAPYCFPPRDTTVVFPFHLLLMVLVLDGLNVARVHKTLHLDLF